MMAVRVTIVGYLGDEPQPGLVDCQLVDASGTEHRFVDKVPIFTSAELDAASCYPQPGVIACRVVGWSLAEDGRRMVTIDTAWPWQVEASDGQTVFQVTPGQLVDLGGMGPDLTF